MNQQSYWVTDITVKDPETNLPVELSIYKHQNGGMFAVDSSYIEQVLEEDQPIPDPFGDLDDMNYVQLLDEPFLKDI